MVKVLGIDPGSQFLGFGVVSDSDSGQPNHIEHGVVVIPKKLNFTQKLVYIKKQMDELIARVNPTEVVVENIFFGKNADSAFKLGHVRGVILCAAGEKNLEVFEYAPKKIKKIVTGNGGASKEHVCAVVSGLLQIEINGKLDASDALSLAVAQLQLRDVQSILDKAKEENYDSFA